MSSELSVYYFCEEAKLKYFKSWAAINNQIEETDIDINDDLAETIKRIQKLPDDWHDEGPLNSIEVLEAFIKNATKLPFRKSMETGTGKSTLLLSHMSSNHLVFTSQNGNSYKAVSNSDILYRPTVKFILGSTQATLPPYSFNEPLDFAFIDGPHGYPFPELEYFFIYPHLNQDALLVVDDIHIPTIFNLFSFLCVDDMFELLEVVDTTAFFRRTSATVFNPMGDGWELQKYNAEKFPMNRLDIELTVLSAKHRSGQYEDLVPAWDKMTPEKHLHSIVNSLPYRIWVKARKFVPRFIRKFLGSRN